jgi:hypothetical protein
MDIWIVCCTVPFQLMVRFWSARVFLDAERSDKHIHCPVRKLTIGQKTSSTTVLWRIRQLLP